MLLVSLFSSVICCSLSASTSVIEEADVSPSMMFSSVAVAVTPSKMFNSAVVDVTPSKMFYAISM